MSTFTSLPTDIFTIILIRLPIKEILQCRAVCKEWRNTINGRDFIKLHLKYSPIEIDDYGLSLVHPSHDIFWLLSSMQRCSFTAAEVTFRVLGSCNGVVALGSLFGETIFSNPSTRKRIKITDPPRSKSLSILMGFGYDSVNDDYKLLRTMYCGWDPNPFHVEVMVYSLNSKTWKKAGYLSDCMIGTHSCWFCTHSGNSLYWIVRRWQGLECFGDSKLIVAFNLVTEQCREISLPDHDHKDKDLHIELANLEGVGLAVMALRNRPGSKSPQRLEAWVIMKDSWTKWFSLDPVPWVGFSITHDWDPEARCDWVFLYTSSIESIRFDPKSMTFTAVNRSSSRALSCFSVCEPSLELMIAIGKIRG